MATTLRYLPGDQFNHLIDIPTALIVTSENSVFVRANLYDNRPSKPFRFGSNAASNTITADLNRTENGDLETGDLTNWTDNSVDTGVVAASTVSPHNGTYALSVNGGTSGTGSAYLIPTLSAGKTYTLEAKLIAPFSTGAIGCRVQNQKTQKFLTSTGGWSGSASDVFSHATTAWSSESITFDMESFGTVTRDNPRLLISFRTTENAAAYADDVVIYPDTDFISVHGHNINPLTVPLWGTAATSGGAWTDTTLTSNVVQPAFYAIRDTPVSARWQRLFFTNLNDSPDGAIYIGQLVFGQTKSLAKNQDYGWRLAWHRDQVRNVSPSGDAYVNPIGGASRRRLTMRFLHDSKAQRDEVQEEFYERSEHGGIPMVVVPSYDSATDVFNDPAVVFGRVGADIDFSRPSASLWQTSSVVVEESPFPIKV